MRKTTTIIAGLLLLFLDLKVQAQINLSWQSSFLPSWSNGNTSGNANNIGSSPVNCSVNLTINGGGSFKQTHGNSGSQTPTVSGTTFIVPGVASSIQLTPNFSNNSGYIDIVLSFTTVVNNVSFRIVDIDRNAPNSNSYYDMVTVTGTDGTSTYNAILAKYDAVTDPDFLVINGNTASVNTNSGFADDCASDATDQRGTVNVSFGTNSLSSVTIRFTNAPGAKNNPGLQDIGIGNISFLTPTLPVTLIAFNGHRDQTNVFLDWKTSQEINSASFVVQRSSNANNWTDVATLLAAGNSSSDRSYSFTDPDAREAVLFYRLKQVDIDGHFLYSTVIKLSTKESATDIKAYPNPFTDQVNVNIHSNKQQPVSGLLVDNSGKIIQTIHADLFSGDNNIMVSGLNKLAKGIYYLQLYDETGNLVDLSKLLK
jgi:hypothetical protein